MAIWDAIVPQDELDLLQQRGFGGAVTLGERPCLIVIDVVMSFLGRRPGDETGEQFATGCGKVGWDRLPTIVKLLDAARTTGLARVLTKGSPDAAAMVGGAIKLSADPHIARRTHSAGFPVEIEPRADEFVLEKTKASAFFLTPLLTFLHQHNVDSIILVGTTTSGCVRATAVDAASFGYPVVVVEDACFDRSPFAHAANLFDIEMKYGSVVTSDELLQMLANSATTPTAAIRTNQ
ncbi:isochorismatase family protein [Cryobacterium sp. Hh7]|uniref:isochorismatase family protein n=1 Tax=Cryobacterium sp. Hh7 TaxID=1259159 RepID=UPI00106CEB9B|nr:isochorismatase family protein [Cryobacterium sp. Hh7]TFD56965.1 isochorismatase family protein [Cryobacterium sp. Hh7]